MLYLYVKGIAYYGKIHKNNEDLEDGPVVVLRAICGDNTNALETKSYGNWTFAAVILACLLALSACIIIMILACACSDDDPEESRSKSRRRKGSR